ncbi:MAG: endonuclease/exonuclease/phosphatase family protein [Flavobacteriales bacterium]
MKHIARHFGRLVMAANLLLVLALLLAYLSRYVSPQTSALLAIVGLGYPVWFLGNVLFLTLWLFSRKRKRALISLGALVLGWSVHMAFWNPIGGSSSPETPDGLSVVTYNVKLFDVYHAGTRSLLKDSILQVLVSSDADVYCLQEYYRTDRTDLFPTERVLVTQLGAPHHLESVVHDATGKQHFGVALFSRYPIAQQGEVNLISDRINRCIYADIVKGKDTVRVYSAHVASIRFGKEDYDFVSGREEEKGFWSGGKRLTARLMDAYHRRAEQVAAIRAHMADSPHPVVLCGDFNDTPASHAYRELDHDLEDSFREANRGLGRTYVGTFPSFRIDYIWHSPRLKAASCEVLKGDFSDHRAVKATLVPCAE